MTSKFILKSTTVTVAGEIDFTADLNEEQPALGFRTTFVSKSVPRSNDKDICLFDFV